MNTQLHYQPRLVLDEQQRRVDRSLEVGRYLRALATPDRSRALPVRSWRNSRPTHTTHFGFGRRRHPVSTGV